jgi:phosphohistidine phosphatase SixA
VWSATATWAARLGLCLYLYVLAPLTVLADEAVWAALKQGGHVVLLRHTETVPGIGDPPGYKLDDCKTQRNLNEAGRAQARALGAEFSRRTIPITGVFSSVWCRCVETATLAFGRVDTWPALNSHFEQPAAASQQAEQVLGGLGIRMRAGQNLVLVTHQVNISTLTGRHTSMGEAVVARVVMAKQASSLPSLAVVGTVKLP